MILCLETATTNCSVALGAGPELLGIKEDRSLQYSHAERLHVFIDELLKENKVARSEIEAVAVSKGPGSYTGLRIGVSAAKGLCFALDLPLISVDTLKSLALQAEGQEASYVIPMLDARRMEVYTAGYEPGLKPVFHTRAEILDPTSFTSYLGKGKVIFIGNGARKFQEICQHENAVFLPDSMPSAVQMLSSAHKKFQERDFENLAYFEPFYLKDFQAG